MTEDTPVRIEITDGIGLLRLDHPASRNALSVAMREGIAQGLRALNSDPAVAGIILAGSETAFCAGGDVSTMARMSRAEAEARLTEVQKIPRLLHNSPKPVVAAVEGLAVGAGMGLATVCDLVVAGEAARFVTGFEKVGLMPDLGAGWSVAARIGVQAARRLFLLGGSLTAEAAGALGLCDFVVPQGSAEAKAAELIRQMASGAPSTRQTVRELYRDPPATLEAGLAFERERQVALYIGEDMQEGLAALREKRRPVWKAR